MACQVVEGRSESSGASRSGNPDLTHARIFSTVNEDVNQPVNSFNTIGGPNE